METSFSIGNDFWYGAKSHPNHGCTVAIDSIIPQANGSRQVIWKQDAQWLRLTS